MSERFVLIFDYRSDGGPRLVGPFDNRNAAFAWAELAIAGGAAEYHVSLLYDPQESAR